MVFVLLQSPSILLFPRISSLLRYPVRRLGFRCGSLPLNILVWGRLRLIFALPHIQFDSSLVAHPSLGGFWGVPYAPSIDGAPVLFALFPSPCLAFVTRSGHAWVDRAEEDKEEEEDKKCSFSFPPPFGRDSMRTLMGHQYPLFQRTKASRIKILVRIKDSCVPIKPFHPPSSPSIFR